MPTLFPVDLLRNATEQDKTVVNHGLDDWLLFLSTVKNSSGDPLHRFKAVTFKEINSILQ